MQVLEGLPRASFSRASNGTMICRTVSRTGWLPRSSSVSSCEDPCGLRWPPSDGAARETSVKGSGTRFCTCNPATTPRCVR